MTLKVSPSPRKYPKQEQKVEFYRNVLEKVRAMPGVSAAAIAGGLPVVGTLGAVGVSFSDRPEPPMGGRPSLPIAFVSPGYFEALGIPIAEGRGFRETDDRPEAQRTAIVNQAFAAKYFPGESAIGKRIEFGSRNGSWSEIVGIAGNVKQLSQRAVDPYLIYGVLANSFEPETFLVVKSRGIPAESLTTAMVASVRNADPNEPVFNVASMEDRLEKSVSNERTSMSIMSVFSGFALLLAATGIFGTIAYYVSQRRQEIAVRMALGATARDIARMVLARGLTQVVAGVGLGIAAAWALSRFITWRGVPAVSPLAGASAAAAIFVIVVAVVACLLPVRWATGVDPSSALRG